MEEENHFDEIYDLELQKINKNSILKNFENSPEGYEKDVENDIQVLNDLVSLGAKNIKFGKNKEKGIQDLAQFAHDENRQNIEGGLPMDEYHYRKKYNSEVYSLQFLEENTGEDD